MTSPYAGDRAADIGAAPPPAEPPPAEPPLARSDPGSATAAAAARPAAAAPGPLDGRPEQSPEDTDAAWGEYPQSRDDDHLYRDRPPHWDNY
jgi:hypothetical protein